MNKKKYCILSMAFAILLCAGGYTYGQSDFGRALNKPGVYLDAYIAPSVALQDAQFDQQAKLGYQLYNVSVDFNMLHHNLPERNKVTHIAAEVSFRYQHFALEGELSAQLPETVYGLDYMVVASHAINSRWSVIGLATLGVFSDFEALSGRDVLISGGLFGVFTINPRIQVGLGPELTYAFGKPMLLPTPYLNWYIGNKLLLDIQAPEHAILHYNASALLHFKLAGRFGLGTQYNIHVAGTKDEASLLFSEGTLGLDTELQLSDHFSLELDLAYAIYRRLGLSDKKGFSAELLPHQKYDPKAAFLPSLSLHWNL